MASVNVSVELPAGPEKVWSAMADLARFEEWLTIHQGWRGSLPDVLAVGSRMTEIVSVMGMANKIEWTVDAYDPPRSLRISGTGMAGVRVSFTLSVEPLGDKAKATIDAEFSGQMVVGPIGAAVEKNSRGELEKSLAKLTELVA
ncbi:type II toxin-antitoxin system Rv0910 family toxin [Actinocrispum wychmicini]|uniref:Polyketide cyclase/dehydrase/lipid transport protein n=1 Tax=Actinocrispum wychmicini TaxID=1213861 RepID=A0A4R2K744_9PSEU|nr:SRPBCC family protein [Actinocrispum wychmicini]TCO65786.1 polyketide cyclase/dehydrase/lipid transport protein [Actinocrispum wychmicini]